MNTNVFYYERLDAQGFGIRDTEVKFSMGSLKLFTLPPADVVLMPLQVLAGAVMLMLSAVLMSSVEGVDINVVPLLLVAMAAVGFALALDVGRAWWLLVASAQLVSLAFVGYMLAAGAVTVIALFSVHGMLVMALLADYRALAYAPIRVWLGAEIGLLMVQLLL